jgi:hypothetical protein
VGAKIVSISTKRKRKPNCITLETPMGAAVSIRLSIFVVTGLLLTSVAAQAVPVTVNLGQSAENFVEYGLGLNSDNLGTYAFDQGACAFDGTNTTCTLSGAFTGSVPGFTSGTYTLVTKYGGNNRTTALVGTSISSNPNFFTYTSASPSLSITLNLVAASGTFVQPVVVGGAYLPAVTTFGFAVVPPYTCSGVAVAPCTLESVGLTNGAIGQSRVTTVVSFDVPSTGGTPTPTPTPGPCVGDCNGDHQVTVNELIQMVSIALGIADVSTCLAGDANGDGEITVNEIVAGVNNALNGCTPQAGDLTGTWSLIDGYRASSPCVGCVGATLSLTQSEQSISGSFSGPFPGCPDGMLTGTVSGTVNNSQVSLTLTDVNCATPYSAFFTGTISGNDQMGGTWSDTHGVTGNWAASRTST